MGLVQTLLGGKQLVRINNGLGTVITLDASISETHSRESPATEFEIESGTTISDNIIIKPFAIEITGVISDTPLSLAGELLTTAVNVAAGPVGVLAGSAGALIGTALTSAVSGSQSPSQKAYSQLLSLQDQKNPFTVTTSLRTYTNMWIKNLTVPRDPATGQILQFTLSMVQLIIVAPQTVVLQIFANPDTAAKEADTGRNQLGDKLVSQGQAGFKFEQSIGR